MILSAPTRTSLTSNRRTRCRFRWADRIGVVAKTPSGSRIALLLLDARTGRGLSTRFGGDAGPVLLQWLGQNPARPRCRGSWPVTGMPRRALSGPTPTTTSPTTRRYAYRPKITTAIIIGVDTHAATHALCVVTAPTGAVQDKASLPASSAGLKRARTWIAHRAGQQAAPVVIEGPGSYEAGLSERVLAVGFSVAEPSVMGSAHRRGVG